MEERGNRLEEWNSGKSNIGNPVGDNGEAGCQELEEETKVNNAIGGNQLEYTACKLSQGTGKYSNGRSQKIIGQGI